MTSQWRGRLLGAGLVWLGLVLTLGLSGLRPNVIVIAAVVGVLALVAWLTNDLSDIAPSIDWRPSGATATTSYGSDRGTRTLWRQLSDQERSGADPRLHTLLVGIIDERLLVECRVDRAGDPERAAAVLGPELSAFIAATGTDAGLADAARLDQIITRIESIGTEATP